LRLITMTRTHTHTHTQLVGLLWTWDRPVADNYLTTHISHNRHTIMTQAEFEPAIPASKRPQTHCLRCVHTCNVTAYRNAITLQVTDMIQSYHLNFHPVPHGVTVSCERYTMGFHFVTGGRSIATLKKARGEDGGDVSIARPDLLRPFDATAKYRQRTEHARNITV
jgi:hypothetical protein